VPPAPPHAVIRFIQIGIPLPPLKLMGQSRRGVMGLLEVQVSLLIMATLRFIQLMAPLPLLKVMGFTPRCN
jgi:hypothetical protein